MSDSTRNHKIVSEEDWIEARKKLLVKEKEFTRLQDELNQERRDLPWVKVTKNYVFDGPNGKETLADLFEGRSQLIIYHFMFGLDDNAGCPHCSLRADGFNGINIHLKHRDVTMIAVSRAPYEKLAAYKKRMGWGFKWVSSGKTDFNFDLHVSFTPEEMKAGKAFFNYIMQNPGPPDREGHSVFYKDDNGGIFHTYSCYVRGNELFNIHYHYLDIVPKGRDENGRGPFWVRRRDEYETGSPSDGAQS
ncbi:MAG TPA: thioredoxin family protein [Bryobacteraceae bacterium]|nr:thioredoxin family protein [Bryobacteraceae bacterium]